MESVQDLLVTHWAEWITRIKPRQNYFCAIYSSSMGKIKFRLKHEKHCERWGYSQHRGVVGRPPKKKRVSTPLAVCYTIIFTQTYFMHS